MCGEANAGPVDSRDSDGGRDSVGSLVWPRRPDAYASIPHAYLSKARDYAPDVAARSNNWNHRDSYVGDLALCLAVSATGRLQPFRAGLVFFDRDLRDNWLRRRRDASRV